MGQMSDPTNGVKALTKVVVLRILQSHQIHLTMSQQ